jgi:uncharacterized surface protein with fasciclin (FAS1) repeats
MQVLTNHVIFGDILVSALQDQETLTTIEGKDLLVRVDSGSGSVYISGAKVTTADLSASNGDAQWGRVQLKPLTK